MEISFRIFTQDVVLVKTIEDVVQLSNEIVEYKYSKHFLMVGGRCIVENKIKTKLINANWATESQLEGMTLYWGKIRYYLLGHQLSF